jgi:LysM repeat protein
VVRSMAAVCPHLRSREGPWRVRRPSSEHRCALLGKTRRIDAHDQSEFCLSGSFRRCPVNAQLTYDGRRTLVGTSPILFERRLATVPGVRVATYGGRRLAQWAFIGLIVVAGVTAALVLARGLIGLATAGAGNTTPHASVVLGGAGASASARAGVRPGESQRPGATGSGTAGPAPTTVAARPSLKASLRPTPHRTPRPGSSPPSGRTYTVQKGDSLWSIAQATGTTIAVLRQVNGLAPGATLHVGQVIKLP